MNEPTERITLRRDTVCMLFSIRSPQWNGNAKRREVGLAQYRIGKHNEIEFTYRRKDDGQLSIPDRYYFDGDLLNQIDFEKQVIKGVTLIKIPFYYLKILERA